MGARDRFMFRTFVPRSARRADRVLAISERTKRDLIEHYGIPERKIVVTPLGVDPTFRPNGTTPDGPPYALFVGGIQPRKDPLTAIEALALVDGDLRLVLVGDEKRGGDEVRSAIERLGLERRVEFAGYVEHEGLASLYRGAACLVFPSRYEGFGLPVLESMASGTPVVASTAGRRARGGRRCRRARRAGRPGGARRGHPARRSPTATASSRPGSSAREAVHLGGDRPADARGLPRAPVSERVAGVVVTHGPRSRARPLSRSAARLRSTSSSSSRTRRRRRSTRG